MTQKRLSQKEVISYCDQFLEIGNYTDYCPNGLQVEGDDREVRKIAIGVSISLDLIEKAIDIGADLIITHHGLFWNKDERIIRGPMRKKLHLLMNNGIAAAAYHLPLDFHPQVGNNIQLARQIGLGNLVPFAQTPRYAEGVMGKTNKRNINELCNIISKILEREPTVLPFGPEQIKTVAIITGGAQGFFLEAIDAGADCFITGEISEKNYTMSREHGVHFISAGHYSSEKFGIQSLGQHLEDQFDLGVDFIHIPNPV